MLNESKLTFEGVVHELLGGNEALKGLPNETELIQKVLEPVRDALPHLKAAGAQALHDVQNEVRNHPYKYMAISAGLGLTMGLYLATKGTSR